MTSFITQTGLGYIREIATGKIVCKADLPPGEHPIAAGFEFVQVESREAMDAVQLIKPEIIETEDQQVKQLISEELEKMALERLITAGKVRADYGIAADKQ